MVEGGVTTGDLGVPRGMLHSIRLPQVAGAPGRHQLPPPRAGGHVVVCEVYVAGVMLLPHEWQLGPDWEVVLRQPAAGVVTADLDYG